MRKTYLLPAFLATAVATLPGAAQATSTTCSTSVVCAEYINTYSGTSGGVAIHGESNTGIGIRGTSVSNTGFYGASGSGSYLAPGVEGESTNNAGSDAAAAFGLAYLTTNKAANAPQFGALAYGRGDGIYGESESPGSSSNYGYGVFGRETQGTSSSDYNAGVLGESTYGTGGLFEANGAPSVGVIGEGAPVGVYAVGNVVAGSKVGGAGIFAESNSTASAMYNSVEKSGLNTLDGNDFMFGYDSSGSPNTGTFYIDYSGNMELSGTLMTSKGTYVRTAGSSGTARLSYSARMSAPDIEDVGEGEMIDGRAVVKIDAALADSIDMRRAYHVFVTPEGDCKGLYVTQKSPAGFVVRELQGGRSTLTFDYRIVAKPLDDDGGRLALAPPLQRPNGLTALSARAHASTAPASPQDVLRQRLGPQGYAKALADVRSRIAGR